MTGRISKIGDGGVRTALYEAANVILTRPVKGSTLKSWGMRLAARAGMRKAKVALARKLAVVLHRMLRRRNELPRRQSGRGRNPLRKGDRRFGRSRHQPPGARSRRRDDGSGQAACYTAAPYGRLRAFRLADLLLIRPHQVAAKRRPRTEERLRRQDQGSEGLTNRGP